MIAASLAGVGAWHDAPRGATPVQCERVRSGQRRGLLRADGPHVIRSNRHDGGKSIVHLRANVRTGDEAPSRAVPVECKSGVFVGGATGTDGPDVVRGDNSDAGKATYGHAGIGDDGPRDAVPMLDERRGRGAGNADADGPDIVGGYCGYRLKNIDGCARVRALDDGPLTAVPMFNQRPGFCEGVVRVGGADGPRIVVRGGGYAVQFVGLIVGVGAVDERPVGP